MKIIYLDEAAVNLDNDMDYSALSKLGEFITYPNTKSEDDVMAKAEGSECILVINKVKITRKVVESLPALQHVAVTATGYNNVDLAACAESGVTVSNVPGYSTDSVVQHVFAMMLNLATRASQYHSDIQKGDWQASENFTLLKYPTFELKGKVLGIIGYGLIGQEVAKVAKAFGMKVLVHRKSNSPADDFPLVSLDELYEKSDVISIHCPLTEDNQSMIDTTVLKKMKSSALLINTARGPLVNQADLAIALKEGQIAGAGIDVLDEEPPKQNPLIDDIPNLILTPHSAWSTVEARQRLINKVALNVEAFLNGEERNLVG